MTVRRRLSLVLIAAAVVSAFIIAAPTALAQGTPKEAVEKLNAAVEKKDPKAMAACLAEPFASMMDKFAPFQASQKKLGDAVDKKFGPGSAAEAGLVAEDEMPFEGKAELLEVKEEGDKAKGKIKYLKNGQPEEKPIEFVKKDGVWKIIPPGAEAVDPKEFEAQVKQMEGLIPKMQAAFEKLAGEVEAGKYATKEDFSAAYMEAMGAAMMGGGGEPPGDGDGETPPPGDGGTPPPPPPTPPPGK